MKFRTLMVLASTLALLALSGCKDKGGDDSGSASLTVTSQVLPA